MTEYDWRMCACGRPLHYQNPESQALIQRLVDIHGPDVRVTIGDHTWSVQRHYIALHGLRGWELPGLGFPEVEAAVRAGAAADAPRFSIAASRP